MPEISVLLTAKQILPIIPFFDELPENQWDFELDLYGPVIVGYMSAFYEDTTIINHAFIDWFNRVNYARGHGYSFMRIRQKSRSNPTWLEIWTDLLKILPADSKRFYQLRLLGAGGLIDTRLWPVARRTRAIRIAQAFQPDVGPAVTQSTSFDVAAQL